MCFMGKAVQMSEKVELSALQLVLLLDKAICAAINRIEDGEDFDTMEVARDYAVMYVATHRKEEK